MKQTIWLPFLRKRRSRPPATQPKSFAIMPSIASALADERVVATRRDLQYAVMPLWFITGVADYICRRRSRIETTSGAAESSMHSIMMAEAGIPVLAGLYLELNAGVIALSLGALLAHEVTMLWDVAYAVRRRFVSPTEQHVHSALEMLPFCALSFLLCLH